jgi:hypothetical protein
MRSPRCRTSRNMNSVYLSNVNESHRRCVFRIFPRVRASVVTYRKNVSGPAYLEIRGKAGREGGGGGNIARRNAIPRPRPPYPATLNPIFQTGDGRRTLTAMTKARGSIGAASRVRVNNRRIFFVVRSFKRDLVFAMSRNCRESRRVHR